ncbi:glycosyltransferase family 15 protein [Lentinula edodes]|uniref:Glycosyltransferase family 15 protein n=1 Tax=Lentinula edodes TaxID=5353 RepID=A0A1Q3EDA3_LENED|nr:glycosyltransferase family 15 protein [Lentinula edodes]
MAIMNGTRPMLRHVFMVFILLVAYHYIPSSLQDQYSAYTNSDEELRTELDSGLANATFVMLVRNSDLDGTISSVRALEDRFNSKFGYPYVFLNNEPFTDEFKRRVSVLIRSEVEFGLIQQEHWSQPDWIDEEKAEKARKKMVALNVKYGVLLQT